MNISVVILDLFLSSFFLFFLFFKLTKFGKLHRVEITWSAVEQVFYPLFFGKVLRFFSDFCYRICDRSKIRRDVFVFVLRCCHECVLGGRSW